MIPANVLNRGAGPTAPWFFLQGVDGGDGGGLGTARDGSCRKISGELINKWGGLSLDPNEDFTTKPENNKKKGGFHQVEIGI